MNTPTESVLFKIAAGDGPAMRACLRDYGGLVWSLARRYFSSHAEAEDAVQDIFIAVWESAHRFDPNKGSETLFIATIARRRLIDRLRRESRRPRDHGDEMPDLPDSHHLSPDLGVEASQARQAMERLRPEQRRVLELGIIRGLTHEEIVTQTGMPLGTVKTHLRRGLIKLRELLETDDAGGAIA